MFNSHKKEGDFKMAVTTEKIVSMDAQTRSVYEEVHLTNPHNVIVGDLKQVDPTTGKEVSIDNRFIAKSQTEEVLEDMKQSLTQYVKDDITAAVVEAFDGDLYTKEEADSIFPNRDEIQEQYLDKQQAQELYVDKSELESGWLKTQDAQQDFVMKDALHSVEPIQADTTDLSEVVDKLNQVIAMLQRA